MAVICYVLAAALAKYLNLKREDFDLLDSLMKRELEQSEEKEPIGFVGGDLLQTPEEYYEEME